MNLVHSADTAMLGYDATETRGRRRAISSSTMSEDRQANDRKRKILSSNSRDLSRNFAIAAWAIRKHLDFVSRFTFQAKTGDRGYDRELEGVVTEAMNRHRFDVAARHSYRRALRIAEACRVKDGDLGWLKLAGTRNRGMIQAIEGDRIKTPDGGELPDNTNPDDWVNGVRVNSFGKSMAYAICDRSRTSNRLTLNRLVSSRNIIVHGFYDRYDQVRGVSPIAAGLNWFRDTYEGFEYALAKVKISQLFGLAFYRDSTRGAFGDNVAQPTVDADEDGEADAGYEVDLSKGPFQLDLDPGDRAEFLENKTPAAETVDFLKMMIHVALKSLDIPYSFFDESFTNFYGSRGGLIQYLKSCQNKIEDLQEFQNEWAQWRLGLMLVDGELELPAGKDFSFLKWEWVPDGVPWWDPLKEVKGNKEAVSAGFTSPQRVCREVGTDFETNIRETAEAFKLADELGVSLESAYQSGTSNQDSGDVPGETSNEEDTKEEEVEKIGAAS